MSSSARILILFLCALSSFSVSSPAQTDDELAVLLKALGKLSKKSSTPWIRIVKGKSKARLEVACVTYENLDQGLKVTLISAIHIADRSFYELLQKELKRYDRVVFEGVVPDVDASNVMLDLVTELQLTLKDALGLTFQGKELDMKAPHLVRGDLKASELKALLDARGVSLFPREDLLRLAGPLLQKGLKWMTPKKGQPLSRWQRALRHRLKLTFAEVLSRGYELYARISDPKARIREAILIGARNRKALSVLDELIKEKPSGHYAILYGAAHQPAFEEAIKERYQLQKVETRWLAAWNLSRSVVLRKKQEEKSASRPTSRKRASRSL